MFDYLNSTMMAPGEYSGCQPLTHTYVARTLFRAPLQVEHCYLDAADNSGPRHSHSPHTNF
jgi:hypothetical protein